MVESNDRKQQLDKDLRSLSANLPALRDIAAKKASVVARQSGAGSYTVGPIPVNLGAWQLLQDILKFARELARALRFAPSFDAEFVFKGTLRHLDDLLARPDAASVCEIAHEASKRLSRHLEPPPAMVMIGKCLDLDCRAELWCGEDDLASGWTVCPRCGRTTSVHEVQQLRMVEAATYGVQGTAADISAMLRDQGIKVRRQTISQWKNRGIIQPVGQQDGKPVFLVWDVWKAMNR
ncbi:hypothetical protein [Bifidobacterium sp. ESL0790]|uniref:hypothetical protein n=1 Tax=Bifidobacterium sp. ESL0790 TaxID=2983233 RepID=UPI0023F9CADB|nr:hypothetical protein [Bifidobacterium sp. ESL0790]WEV72137.1 hypothetical protein OZY47_06770 [Bifidobacterium sp. ESL0790]